MIDGVITPVSPRFATNHQSKSHSLGKMHSAARNSAEPRRKKHSTVNLMISAEMAALAENNSLVICAKSP